MWTMWNSAVFLTRRKQLPYSSQCGEPEGEPFHPSEESVNQTQQFLV